MTLEKIIGDLPEPKEIDTPEALLLPNLLRRRFARFAKATDKVGMTFDGVRSNVALSVKTNPHPRLLQTARSLGMLAETIHPDEMSHIQEQGFSEREIVINGPAQTLFDFEEAPCALFGDTISDLENLSFDPSGAIVGVRTRPPERGPSRFGVDLSCEGRMDRFCDVIKELPESTLVGLHMHAPASSIGASRWWESLSRVLQWAREIRKRTGREIEALDLGGGWYPEDWLTEFVPGLLARKEKIMDALPALQTILFEPGKALSQPLGVLATEVIDTRPSRSEVVVDGSIAELSNIDYHDHRYLAHTEKRGWHRLPRGEGRVLGRVCMERDIFCNQRKVSHLSQGDLIVACDAGAYDMSMRYPFGRGKMVGAGSKDRSDVHPE